MASDSPAAVRARADDLRARRVPFVAATVVRAERPTSAKPGDTALVLGDGSIVGFVGGACAEASVAAQGLHALETGQPVLLRVTPDGQAERRDGAVSVHNPCLSGGTLEIFLEPALPPLLVVVHGAGPIAHAVLDLAGRLGYATAKGPDGPLLEVPIPAIATDADAVVVASHGRGESEVLLAALSAGVPYVGLVASRRRGAAVVAGLAVDEAARARIRTPAGIDIGARTPEEVALSILAEIVSRLPRAGQSGHQQGPAGPGGHQQGPAGPGGHQQGPAGPATAMTAVDPVCGMTVVAGGTSLHTEHGGTRQWFCGSGCLKAFVADPGTFAAR